MPKKTMLVWTFDKKFNLIAVEIDLNETFEYKGYKVKKYKLKEGIIYENYGSGSYQLDFYMDAHGAHEAAMKALVKQISYLTPLRLAEFINSFNINPVETLEKLTD